MKILKYSIIICVTALVIWIGLYCAIFKVEEFNENKKAHDEHYSGVDNGPPLNYSNKPRYRNWYLNNCRLFVVRHLFVYKTMESIFYPLSAIWKEMDFGKVQ